MLHTESTTAFQIHMQRLSFMQGKGNAERERYIHLKLRLNWAEDLSADTVRSPETLRRQNVFSTDLARRSLDPVLVVQHYYLLENMNTHKQKHTSSQIPFLLLLLSP